MTNSKAITLSMTVFVFMTWVSVLADNTSWNIFILSVLACLNLYLFVKPKEEGK